MIGIHFELLLTDEVGGRRECTRVIGKFWDEYNGQGQTGFVGHWRVLSRSICQRAWGLLRLDGKDLGRESTTGVPEKG